MAEIEEKSLWTRDSHIHDSGVASLSWPSAINAEFFNIEKAIGNKLEWDGIYLGEGSFGKVIQVTHRTDKCEYAVKLMECILGQENKKKTGKHVREKYQRRELKLLTEQVSSPTTHINIVKYYDSWKCTETNPPLLCIRMELCDQSLETLLQEDKGVVDNPLFYWNLFPQILCGLKYLHKKNWVHRDIYPPNILLAVAEYACLPIHSRVIKIADFGLARRLEQPSLTVSDPPEEMLSAVGNKLYRAPEMKTKTNPDSGTGTEVTEPTVLSYDFKVDLYSAGLVLYRMCRYFENESVITGELESIQQSGLVDKRHLSHHHECLHQLLDDLLKQNPEERLSASEALECFEKNASPVLNETDAPTIPRIFARKSSSSSYVRIHSSEARSYNTILTCLVKDLEINDIECFNIIEESDLDCRQKIKNDTDWEKLLFSAGDERVKLVVEPKSEEEPDLC